VLSLSFFLSRGELCGLKLSLPSIKKERRKEPSERIFFNTSLSSNLE
jgi:hypothetical protein